MWIFLRKRGFTKFGGFWGSFPYFPRKTDKKARFSQVLRAKGGGLELAVIQVGVKDGLVCKKVGFWSIFTHFCTPENPLSPSFRPISGHYHIPVLNPLSVVLWKGPQAALATRADTDTHVKTNNEGLCSSGQTGTSAACLCESGGFA